MKLDGSLPWLTRLIMISVVITITPSVTAQELEPKPQPEDSFQAPFQAVAGCPPQSWFQTQLTGSSPLAAQLPESALTTRVSSTPSSSSPDSSQPRGLTGEVTLTLRADQARSIGLSASTWTRQIEGVHCEEVLQALAMSLALHLEGLQSEASEAEPDPARVNTGGETRRSTSPLAATNDNRDVDLRELERLMEDSPGGGTDSDETARAGSNWRFGGMFGGNVRTGLGPSPTLGGLVGLTLDGQGVGLGAGYHSLSFTWTPTTGEEAVEQRPPWQSQWWTLDAKACAAGLWLTKGIKWMPCASMHGGAYELAPSDGERDTKWLGFAEFTGDFLARIGSWTAGIYCGGHVPLSPLVMLADGDVLYRQTVGAVLGAQFGLSPEL